MGSKQERLASEQERLGSDEERLQFNYDSKQERLYNY
jgi:hypothetical protein